MVELKTGCLLRAACVGGCALAGEHGAIRQGAAAYAHALGLAFQIQDDILDVTGQQETLGKTIGSDAQNHKNTFVRIYGLEACRRRVDELTCQAVAAVEPWGGQRAFCSSWPGTWPAGIIEVEPCVFCRTKYCWWLFVSWFVAQSLKIVSGLVVDHKLNLKLFFASGGMPSSHTSTGRGADHGSGLCRAGWTRWSSPLVSFFPPL